MPNKSNRNKSTDNIVNTLKNESISRIRKSQYQKYTQGVIDSKNDDGTFMVKINSSSTSVGGFRNLSGSLLMSGDKVYLESIDNNLSNAYISKKISDNNDNHTTYSVNGDNIDDGSINGDHLKNDIITTDHIINKTMFCPMSISTTKMGLYRLSNTDIDDVYIGMAIRIIPNYSSSYTTNAIEITTKDGYKHTYDVVNVTLTIEQPTLLQCTQNSTYPDILEFTGLQGTSIDYDSEATYVNLSNNGSTKFDYYHIICPDLAQREIYNGEKVTIEPDVGSTNNVILSINNQGAYELHDYYNDNVNDLTAHVLSDVGYGELNGNFIC